jgi:hypothetical protein
MADDIFQYIDIERTIAEFGYDPRNFTFGVQKKVFWFCSCCENSMEKAKPFAKAALGQNCASCGAKKAQKNRFWNEIENRERLGLVDEIGCEGIDIEATKEKYGYDPRYLTKKSSQLVCKVCKICGEKKDVKKADAVKSLRCQKCVEIEAGSQNIVSFEGIDIKKTEEVFGYDITKIKFNTTTKVIPICISCGVERPFCGIKAATASKKCSSCSRIGKRASIETKKKMSEARMGEKNPRFGKNHTEEMKKAMSEARKGIPRSEEATRKIVAALTGKKQRKEVVEKRAETHRGKKRSDQTKRNIAKAVKKNYENGQIPPWRGKSIPDEMRKKISKTRIERGCGKGEKNYWFGRTGESNPRYGKPAPKVTGAWYTKKDGSKVWMRSSWEIKFATLLDQKGKRWEYEPSCFPVTFVSVRKEGETLNGTYTPDFFVEGEWFEVKGFWRDDAKPKFEAFKAQYPDEKITLLMKPELLALGIDVK